MSQVLDISGVPRRSFLKSLSQFSTNIEEQEKLIELSSAEGTDLYFDYIVRAKRNYVEVLEDFRSCRPSLHWLLQMIPMLAPRKYSIASSSRLLPNQVCIYVYMYVCMHVCIYVCM